MPKTRFFYVEYTNTYNKKLLHFTKEMKSLTANQTHAGEYHQVLRVSARDKKIYIKNGIVCKPLHIFIDTLHFG